MTNTATAANSIETFAADFANWLCDSVEHMIEDGRTHGLTDDEIAADAKAALVAFLKGR